MLNQPPQWVVGKRGHQWFAWRDGAPADQDRRFQDRERAIAWCREQGYEVRADPPSSGVNIAPNADGGGVLIEGGDEA